MILVIFQARYRSHLESTYGADASSQPLTIDPLAYRFAVGEPNRSRYYGLGSALTVVRHLLEDSHGSTSCHPDDGGSGGGMVSRTSPPDESLLRRIDDLQTREQERQADLTRLREDVEARYRQFSQQFEESQMRLREEMRADAEARDRQLTQRLDEGHTRQRDEFQSRDDRISQSLTDAMDRRMLHMFAFCRDESRGGPSSYDPHRPPRGPPDPPPTA